MFSLTPDMILQARSAIGISKTGYRAFKNSKKITALNSAANQTWLAMVKNGWADGVAQDGANVFKLTGRGLDQLRLQMGEFVFVSP